MSRSFLDAMAGAEFTEAVRALVNELNMHSASGLITQRALVLLNRVEQMLHGIERAQRAEPSAEGEP